MVRKSESPRKRRPPAPYPSLAEGPTPQERLARLLNDAEARGVKPVDEAALEAMGNAWPQGENLEEFLAWLHQSRRTGRYD
ncbi:MAG TPA: hypothetical protein VMS17_33860 [Gemmataceae bacterium]|nr:hypothetical protein [Gemmataceae bacterium]